MTKSRSKIADIHVIWIIPTVRGKEIQKFLESIIKYGKADIMIIADGAPEEKHKEILSIISELKKLNKNLEIYTIRNDRTLISLTGARNTALEFAKKLIKERGWDPKQTVIVFSDDDITIGPGTIRRVKEFLFDKGADGYHEMDRSTVASKIRHKFLRVILAILSLGIPYLPYSCFSFKVDILLRPKIPLCLYTPTRSQWFSGYFMAFKADSIADYRFDEQLIRYSLGEDFDFTYRLWKSGKILVAAPSTDLIHHEEKTGRVSNIVKEVMRFVYHKYFLYKNMKRSRPLGLLHDIIAVLYCVVNKLFNPGKLKKIEQCKKAFILSRKFDKNIFEGDLSEINKIILSFG